MKKILNKTAHSISDYHTYYQGHLNEENETKNKNMKSSN